MEDTKQADVPRLNLDGESYEVTRFSQGVQQAVLIYNHFQKQLQDQQLEVMKTQAAMQTVSAQISEAVRKELAPEKSDETPVDETADA